MRTLWSVLLLSVVTASPAAVATDPPDASLSGDTAEDDDTATEDAEDAEDEAPPPAPVEPVDESEPVGSASDVAPAEPVSTASTDALMQEIEILKLKLELAQARLEAKPPTPLVPISGDADLTLDDTERLPSQFYNVNLNLTALTRNIGLGLSLRYLWAFQTDFGADVLLTPLISGLSLDDIDSIRFTAAQTVAWRMSMFPFRFYPRNVQKNASPWPDLLFGAGVWTLLEADHLAQAFRLGDAGLFMAATVGPFISAVFQDVTLSLAYRPFSIAAFYLDGVWDQRPFAFGNPVLDVSVTWNLPL